MTILDFGSWILNCGRPGVAGGRRTANVTVLAAVLACGVHAEAQSNSLLRQSRAAAPAPTTQPASQSPGGSEAPRANGTALPGVPANPLTARAALTLAPPNAKDNTLLLRVSPLAVDLPSPEKIRVHDQVTIIIRETKTAVTDAKLDSKKDWSLDSELKKWISLDNCELGAHDFENGTPAVLFDYKDDYSGDGKYDRRDELTTRVQATVLDVKPNGTLVLEATKSVQIDDEGYDVQLTGTCRSQDVTPQNSILSTQIADLSISVVHKGAVRDATRRGWLKRGLDWLRPF